MATLASLARRRRRHLSAHLTPALALRERMANEADDELLCWLAFHPEAWHGWPSTHVSGDLPRLLLRAQRLQRAGYPMPRVDANQLEVFLNHVDVLIWRLRTQRTSRYAHMVAQAMEAE